MIVPSPAVPSRAQWQARIQQNLMLMGYPTAPYWKQCILVAASKYADAAMIEAAFHAGIPCMGENRAVEALQKRAQISPDVEQAIEWHFIGHIQKNKLNKIVGHYELLHSVDSADLLMAIIEKARERELQQKILLQVNVSGEESKHGLTPVEVGEVMAQGLQYPKDVTILGLMTMAPAQADDSVLDACFGGLAELRDVLQSAYNTKLPHLSMGMSDDYAHALAHGATIVRIGSKLFA
jgi:PLP dependent protein